VARREPGPAATVLVAVVFVLLVRAADLPVIGKDLQLGCVHLRVACRQRDGAK